MIIAFAKNTMQGKRGEMGVGILILFIAMLIVAAIAAGVFIQTSQGLQQKALITGEETQGMIATSGQIAEISATDGTTGNLTEFSMIMRLVAGSRPVKIEDVFLKLSTNTKTADLRYKGPGADLEKSNTGYNTWIEQEIGEIGVGIDPVQQVIRTTAWVSLEIDLDLDGTNDWVRACEQFRQPCPGASTSGKYLYFNLSEDDDLLVPILGSDGEPVSVCGAPNGPYYTFPVPIGNDSEYGFYMLDGNIVGGCRIDPNHMTIYHGALLNEDFDDDLVDDYIYIHNSTAVTMMLSDAGQMTYDIGADLSVGAQSLDLVMDMSVTVRGRTTDYGDIVIKGITSMADYIDENVTFQVVPEKFGQGYFVAEYLQEGTNSREGLFQHGDMIRFWFEAPNNIGEDEEIRVIFLPKSGMPIMTNFFTPEVISSKQEFLYP